MSQQTALPPWAEELKLRYLSGEASMFLLHGNVRDVYPWAVTRESTAGEPGQTDTRYVPLRRFLEEFLGRSKDIVVYYNVSEGLQFPDRKLAASFRTAVNTRRAARGADTLGALPQTPGEVLPVIEDLITNVTQRSAVILDYTETIVPTGDFSFMSDTDKANLVALQRWSSDPSLLHSDNLVVLVTENLADVHRRVVASTQLAAVSVPLPEVDARESFIRSLDKEGITLEMSELALAKITAGLSLVQIRGLFRRARQSGEPITFRVVSRRKKSIIEQECHGLVEFVDPEHNFDHVGGMDRLKDDLMQVANAIKAGRVNQVPMGMIFVGPMGTGKTFLAEAFAAESGLTCLKFKNFREKWVGSTEGNLEKILQVVEGLGYVLLIIDEADRSLSSGDSDGGTSSRVISRLKEFMSDTSHRGRIVILLLTNRPDKLDTDLKRPGRFDMKIPFFFAESDEERVSILQAVARKLRLPLAEDIDLASAAQRTDGYSSAELEALMLRASGIWAAPATDIAVAEEIARENAEDLGQETLDPFHVHKAVVAAQKVADTLAVQGVPAIEGSSAWSGDEAAEQVKKARESADKAASYAKAAAEAEVSFLDAEKRARKEARAKLDMSAPDWELTLDRAVAEATADQRAAVASAVVATAAVARAILPTIERSRSHLSGEDLVAALADVIPSRDSRMLEFMEMLAVFESSSRRMLPERFQAMTTEEVHSRLDQLRMALGRRV